MPLYKIYRPMIYDIQNPACECAEIITFSELMATKRKYYTAECADEESAEHFAEIIAERYPINHIMLVRISGCFVTLLHDPSPGLMAVVVRNPLTSPSCIASVK